jgi:transposase
MAKPVTQITLGVDVAKDQLVIHHWQIDQQITLENDPAAIRQWLQSLIGPVRLALEPTNNYHLAIVEAAVEKNHQVYLVNPRQLAHYRYAVNTRNKTDADDAWLLARYLEHEAGEMRPFRPRNPQAQRLWALMTRRATVVQSQQRLKQSMREVNFSVQALMTQFKCLLARLDRQIRQLIQKLGWWHDYLYCLSIPGIGPANAAALVATYHRGAFSGSDAFIAYMGLDIRLRESGRYRGKSKLSKQGEPELRRLLYCAAHAARHHPRFAQYHQRMLDNGLSKIAARVALARKLARIAFTLMETQQPFRELPKMA